MGVCPAAGAVSHGWSIESVARLLLATDCSGAVRSCMHASGGLVGDRCIDAVWTISLLGPCCYSQVTAQLAVTMDPDDLPQLWMLLYNASQLQAALSVLSTSLTVTVTGAL